MRKYLALLALGVLAFASTPAQADTITWHYEWLLDHEFSDPGVLAPPEGELWVKLGVDGVDHPNKVILAVDASGLVLNEKVFGVYLNIDPEFSVVTITDLGYVGSDYTPTINPVAQDAYQPDGDGLFDILIQFPSGPPHSLATGETAMFTIAAADSPVVPDDLYFLSTLGGGENNKGPFYVAAHVGGIGPDENSAWVTTNGNGEVPEASTLIMFGSGLSGLLFFVRKKGLIKF